MRPGAQILNQAGETHSMVYTVPGVKVTSQNATVITLAGPINVNIKIATFSPTERY